MRTSSILFAATAVMLLPAFVHAHAFLDHADPKVGSTVAASPTDIHAWFTQEVEPDFSSIVVRDSQGQQVDSKDTHADDKDHHILIVSLPRLADGQYTVTWDVVSVDTHHTHGSFKFTVKTGG